MVAKRGKKSTRGMKDLRAKEVNTKQAKTVKGGSIGGDRPTESGKVGKHI